MDISENPNYLAWKDGYNDALDYDSCLPPDEKKEDYIEGYGDGMDLNLKHDFSPAAIAMRKSDREREIELDNLLLRYDYGLDIELEE